MDGNDVEAVWSAASQSLRSAREGNGPALLECRTYRVVGHHEGDPGTGYRTKGEVDAWKKSHALEAGAVSEGELSAIKEDVDSLVADAVRFAEASPWPDAAAAQHVFPEIEDFADARSHEFAS